MTKQEIQRALKIIDGYLSQLKGQGDSLTQFYSACKIAERALIELNNV